MAIRCEDVPFRLAFIMGNSQVPEEVNSFYKSQEDLYHVSPSVEILENLPLDVIFECDDAMAKLYIEGIDELVSKIVEEEDGRAFISPTNGSIMLFSREDYPLNPGYYQLVIEAKGIFYYAIVSVKPIHVSEIAWELMRDDIENVLPGLAMDLVFRNLGLNRTLGIKAPLPPYSLFSFLVINQNFSRVMSAITDLLTKANFRLRKQYQDKPASSGAVVDDMSFRYKLRRPEKVDTIMSPVKTLDYDLQENRWIKQIIFYIVRDLEEFLIAARQQIIALQIEIEELSRFGTKSKSQRDLKSKTIMDMTVFCNKAKKMQSAFKMLENASWYANVSQLRSGNVPAVLFMDSRYRILYRLYLQIKRYEAIVSLDKTYAYQWKSTEKLYEIWCFIKVCETITNLGFEMCGGWLSDLGEDLEKVLVPAIPSGTHVEFVKENIMIRVSYDAEIPYMIDETNHDNKPIYIAGGHNKPDIKLDFYIDSIYSGSLLMDAKYRKPSRFWEDEKLRTHLRTTVMNQLICYSTQCFSPHLYGSNQFDIHPVPEVWVMYPRDGSSFNNKFFPTHRIRFISLYPNSPNILEKLLEDRIQDFQKRAIAHRQKENE